MSHPTFILRLPMFVEWKVRAEFLSSIGDMSNLVFEMIEMIMILVAEIEGLTGSFRKRIPILWMNLTFIEIHIVT